MGKVAKELRADSTIPITVVAECDIVCVTCPHNKDNKCLREADSESKVKTRDLEVLRGLGFEIGMQMLAGKLGQG